MDSISLLRAFHIFAEQSHTHPHPSQTFHTPRVRQHGGFTFPISQNPKEKRTYQKQIVTHVWRKFTHFLVNSTEPILLQEKSTCATNYRCWY
jgi:hypothetical protein